MVKKKASTTKTARQSVKSDPPISEDSVKRKTDAEVFERGEGYFEDGAIINPVRIGNTLSARCQGSGPAPYRVRVTFSKKGVTDALCNCPYDWGGYCKHSVALLLTHIRAPKKIKVKPPVEELLAKKKPAELSALIVEMVDVSPDLYGLVDGSGLPEEDEYDEGDYYDEW
jgi:uncharacterized Zn finger protein